MKVRLTLAVALVPALFAGCAETPERDTLADLRKAKPDLQDVKVEQGLDMAMAGYRRFLEETPRSAMTPEAMRRLADLQIEKQFGLRAGDGKPREMAAPERVAVEASYDWRLALDVAVLVGCTVLALVLGAATLRRRTP